MLKKNDFIELDIVDLIDKGSGVGRYEGFVVFVKDAVIGDRVLARMTKLNKGYGFARLEQVITPSKDRVEPRCRVANQCGGCQIQCMSYEAQLRYKERRVYELFNRAAIADGIKFNSIKGMDNPYFYRNKAQFPVGRDKDGNVRLGFYAGRTHSIVEVNKCYIQDEAFEEVLASVRNFLQKNNISIYDEEKHTGLVRHILLRVGRKTRQIMVCIVINGDSLPKSDILIKELEKIKAMTSVCINVNKEKTNVIMGAKTKLLWGQDYIRDFIGGIEYQISPMSFFQVNSEQAEVLYSEALRFANLGGNEAVWDVYCGIGTISLFLAKAAKKVYGVEIVPEAIEDAKFNAKLNGVDNAEFFVGKAEEVLPTKYEREGIHADVIVVDPPRKGCEIEVLETIAKMQPKRIVYVSCDPATLVRDVKLLMEKGYEAREVSTVDMFAGTGHVETIVALHRTNS